MTYVDAINLFEAIWWPVLGAVVFSRGRKLPPSRNRLATIAAFWLILFGVSDGIELYTKAWWRPWWLLVLKGTCLAALAGCAIAALLWRKRSGVTESGDKLEV